MSFADLAKFRDHLHQRLTERIAKGLLPQPSLIVATVPIVMAGLKRLDCLKDLQVLLTNLRRGFPHTKEVSYYSVLPQWLSVKSCDILCLMKAGGLIAGTFIAIARSYLAV